VADKILLPDNLRDRDLYVYVIRFEEGKTLIFVGGTKHGRLLY